MPIANARMYSRMHSRMYSVNPAEEALAMTKLLLALALVATSTLAHAWPDKAVRIVIPFAPGGPSDLLGRLVGQKLAEIWAQPVVADNRAGAGGNIGMEAVARASADGYTLVIAPTGNLTVNPSLFAKLGYDPVKDFAPITLLASVDNVLVVHPGVTAANVAELVALAKQKPGTLSFASPAIGSQPHLAGEFLKQSGGIDLVHVVYKGTGPALNDLLAGTITMMFAQVSSALPHIKSGKLRALGIATPKRSAALPDTPTVAEQNFAGFAAVSWYALMAPAGTPAEVISRIHADSVKVLRQPDVRERLAGLGADPVGNTPAELARIIAEETARWARVVKDARIKVE